MSVTKVHPVKQLNAREIVQKQEQQDRAMLKTFNARAKELAAGQKVAVAWTKNA